MNAKKNPLKLNPLQLRTLSLLQALARLPNSAVSGPNPGEVTVQRFPKRHEDHFHVGEFLVLGKDATGLFNEAVWNALVRKGLSRADWPTQITLTADAFMYDTGDDGKIFRRGGH